MKRPPTHVKVTRSKFEELLQVCYSLTYALQEDPCVKASLNPCALISTIRIRDEMPCILQKAFCLCILMNMLKMHKHTCLGIHVLMQVNLVWVTIWC